jgi:hypothetical protein
MAAAFSTGRSAACGALLGSATERSRVWRWRALRSSRAACGAFNFARSMPEVDTGRLNSRDARTAWATLRQVAADGRVASDGRVTSEGSRVASEGSRVASEGMVVSEGAARRRAAGAPDSPPTAREPQILIKKPYSSKNMSDLLLLYLLARRRGADTAHTKMGRPTYEAPIREYTHKHTQTHTNPARNL